MKTKNNLNPKQKEALKKFYEEWAATEKRSLYLWKPIASLIKTSAKEVLEGRQPLNRFEEVLKKAVKSSKKMTISSYYEMALKQITDIISGIEELSGQQLIIKLQEENKKLKSKIGQSKVFADKVYEFLHLQNNLTEEEEDILASIPKY